MTGTFEDGTEELPLRETPARSVSEIEPGRFAITQLGLEPDKKQLQILRSKSKRGILNCSRQWGKSTVAAAKAVHRAYTRPGSLVLVASPSERQSAEFIAKVTEQVRMLEIKPRGDGKNAISILMPNGSRIVGLPGTESTTRGFSNVSLLLIDEAARVPDDLYQGMRPVLGRSGGDLWLMSTPCGQRGFFYEAWANGGDEWFRVRATATECSRLDKKFIEEERREKTADCFAQEYMCEFTTNEEMLFERDLVEAAFDDSLSELNFSRK